VHLWHVAMASNTETDGQIQERLRRRRERDRLRRERETVMKVHHSKSTF